MTGHGAGETGVVGGPARHVPVLLRPVLDGLALDRPGPLKLLDGTFGAGGYARAMLDAAPDAQLLALDRDPTAIAAGDALVAAFGGRLRLREARFGALDAVAEAEGFAPLDGVVLDIGVSSMQLDEAERGFSFLRDGPLDMRMGRDGTSAAELVASLPEAELANLIYRYGEERRSRAVARAIVAARREAPVASTLRLARVVASALPPQRDGPHLATRTFQALRIAVNDELGELERALAAAERALAPGGRLAVVTFHSLEDRIVKSFLRDAAGRMPGASRFAPRLDADAPPRFRLVGPQPVAPEEAETDANPRARSAKLRVAERTSAPAPSAGRRA